MMKDLSLFETTYTEDLYQIAPKTIVAFKCRWNEVSAEERALLSKILAAVNLSLAAIQIVSVDQLQLSDWAEKPKKLIGFGISIPGVAGYEVISTPETALVLADSLGELMKDGDLKKKLWTSLRQLFSL